MQQGRKSSGGQGLPDRAAEEQATTRGRKRVRKAFQGGNSLSPLFAFSVWAVLHSERRLASSWVHWTMTPIGRAALVASLTFVKKIPEEASSTVLQF